MRTYATWDAALRRVEALKTQQGIWPGIAGPLPDGGYRLTFDPAPGDQS
jgi:hypothetical protein